MFEETVQTQDGHTKRVVASDKKELAEAVKAVKAEKVSTPFDINVPVRKGFDLLDVDEALVVEPADGRGAHNSPRSAVRDDGTVEGDPEVPVVVGTNVETEPVVLEDNGEVADKA